MSPRAYTYRTSTGTTAHDTLDDEQLYYVLDQFELDDELDLYFPEEWNA